MVQLGSLNASLSVTVPIKYNSKHISKRERKRLEKLQDTYKQVAPMNDAVRLSKLCKNECTKLTMNKRNTQGLLEN